MNTSATSPSQKDWSLRCRAIRALYALVGVILIGLGAAILETGGVGVDPYTALNIGISETIGWSLGAYQLLSNAILFIPVLIFARSYIGVGTLINMTLTGFFIQVFAGLLAPLAVAPGNHAMAALFFAIGILVFAFGASGYISAASAPPPTMRSRRSSSTAPGGSTSVCASPRTSSSSSAPSSSPGRWAWARS